MKTYRPSVQIFLLTFFPSFILLRASEKSNVSFFIVFLLLLVKLIALMIRWSLKSTLYPAPGNNK